MKATDELAWLNEVSSVPLQQAIRHQQVAFTNFFAGRARHPRDKSRTGRQSAEYTRSGFRYRDGRLFLAKMDVPLAFVWSWPDVDPTGIDPTTVTVSRDPCGRWYISFAVDVADPGQAPATGAMGGNLARYQRRMARRQRGSNNRAKAKANVRNHSSAKSILSLGTRTWQCTACGTRHDRDVNAAKNILAAGLAVSAGRGDVRHSGTSRVQSPVKQEPQPVRAGIPVLQGRE